MLLVLDTKCDPTSWPMQAELAANGEWDKLKEWQDNAKGGKIEE